MVRFEFKLQNHGFCFGIFFKAYWSSSDFQHVLKTHNLPTRIIPDFRNPLFFAITEVSNKKVIT